MVQFLSGIIAVLLALFGLQTFRIQAAKNKAGAAKLDQDVKPLLDKIEEETKKEKTDEENFNRLDNSYNPNSGNGKPLC